MSSFLIKSPAIEKFQAQAFLFVMGFWRRMTLGARALVVDGEKVLLIKHTYTTGWLLPGGGVEAGQHIRETAIREVAEETGYRVKDAGELISVFHNADASRRDHVALFVFKDFEVETPFKPSAEIAEMGWFSIHELPTDTTKATVSRIAEYFGGQSVSDYW